MSEPDELYTLRAQYWLGHYTMAIDEAKSVARRPMSPSLKIEREEFLYRSYLGLGQYDKIINSSSTSDSPGIKALIIKAKCDAAIGQEAVQASLCDEIKSLIGSGSSSSSPCAQLIASQLLLSSGQLKEALQCVYHASSSDHATPPLEHVLMTLQLCLKLDRLDMATQQLQVLKSIDEDSIVTQLGSVYIYLATGSSGSADAIHVLNALCEQYGPSVYLLNLLSCALLQQGDYAGAEQKLQECIKDHSHEATLLMPDTLMNLIVASVQQNKSADTYVSQLQQQFPHHPFCANVSRITSALEREMIKYKV